MIMYFIYKKGNEKPVTTSNNNNIKRNNIRTSRKMKIKNILRRKMGKKQMIFEATNKRNFTLYVDIGKH